MKWLRKLGLFPNDPSPKRPPVSHLRPRRRFVPAIEALEDRWLLDAAPPISLEVLTNGVHVPLLMDPNVPQIAPTTATAVSTVNWTYNVTNNTNNAIPKSGVLVVDDQAIAFPVYTSSNGNNDDNLDPGETWTYTASAAAVDLSDPSQTVNQTLVLPGGGLLPYSLTVQDGLNGQKTYENTPTVRIIGTSLSASDVSHYKNPGPVVGLFMPTTGILNQNDFSITANAGELLSGTVVVRDKLHPGDSVTAMVDYGDLSAPQFPPDMTLDASGSATLSLSHAYTNVGVYTLTLTVTDTTPITGTNTTRNTTTVRQMVVNVVPPPASLSGMVYIDYTNDGDVDVGETGIYQATITLTGAGPDGLFGTTDDTTATTTTDPNGVYSFNVGPGKYTITETQPAGFVDGKDTIGDFGGTTSNDRFSAITVNTGDGAHYNFGELPQSDGALKHGRTAEIGFWHNKRGQALIKSLNGGPSSTALGSWLASEFPNLYAVLKGKTNTDVANYFLNVFNVKGQKLEAQMLALALAVYVTDSSKAGNVAAAYGFRVNTFGTGADTYNVKSDGAGIGVANNTTWTVMQILKTADTLAVNGTLYAGNKRLREIATDLFADINEKGEIDD